MMLRAGGAALGALALAAAPPPCGGFKVLWNSPWPSCCGAKAEKELLPLADPLPQFVQHNITVNTGYDTWSHCNGSDSIPCFNGHEVVTIYTEQIGLYPQYQMNATTHQWYPVNGGLPQLVNMTAHLAAWADDVAAMIPNPSAAPIVGLDMEAWRVAWAGNDPRPMAEPAQAVVQNKSIELVRSQHPDWSEPQLIAEAKRQVTLLYSTYLRSSLLLYRREILFSIESMRSSESSQPPVASETELSGSADSAVCGRWHWHWHWHWH
jgi:hypothetical protein